MKVLITGGSGFLGRSIIKEMMQGNHDLLSLSRSKQNSNENNSLRWLQCSLDLTPEALQEIIDFGPQVVIGLAWDKIPDFSFDTSFTNLQTQISFFRRIIEIGSVKKIILAGSCFEYNKKNGTCLESENLQSGNYFTWAKNTLHDFLRFECARKEIGFIWTRIFYVYGPGQRAAALIPSIIASFREGKMPAINTPANANDFVYVDDVAKGFRAIAEQQVADGIYNLGSGESTSVSGILSIAEQVVTGDTKLTGVQPVPVHPGDINFWADIEKSKKAFGWNPSTTIEAGIRQMQ